MAITLIQITDPHIFLDPKKSLYGVFTNQLLESVIKAIQAREYAPDLFVVTGDLVHDEGEAAYLKLRDYLTSLGVPSYVIPGNHDAPDVMRRLFLEQNVQWKTKLRLEGWQLLFLNTCSQGDVGGRLSKDDYAQLRSNLESCDLPSVIFLHHRVVPVGSTWLDKIALADSDDFLAVLGDYPQVKAVVNGHVHQVFEHINERGARFWGTPSTCAQFKPGVEAFEIDDLSPGWRVIELGENGELSSFVERL